MQPWAGTKIDKVAGMEARGFILGGAVAHQLSAGFVPIRKKGKLPHAKVSIAYSLEYGVDEMEMHSDAVAPGERVILIDDLIATGGTAEGAVKMLKSDRRRRRRRLLRHRPAGPRRREEDRGPGRARAHADGVRRALSPHPYRRCASMVSPRPTEPNVSPSTTRAEGSAAITSSRTCGI